MCIRTYITCILYRAILPAMRTTTMATYRLPAPVSGNIQRMQLSIPAAGPTQPSLPLSSPLVQPISFFILARSMRKNKLTPHLLRIPDGLPFFHPCICRPGARWLHYFWILLSYFPDFSTVQEIERKILMEFRITTVAEFLGKSSIRSSIFIDAVKTKIDYNRNWLKLINKSCTNTYSRSVRPIKCLRMLKRRIITNN